LQRLELDEGKLSRPVLRGGSGSNATSLPDLGENLQVKATKGGKCAAAKGDKLRQVRCRILPQFDTGADAVRFVGRMVKGMVSSCDM
jgi:hypothetical protein